MAIQLLPVPNPPNVQDANLQRWLRDITKMFEVLQDAHEPFAVIPYVLYADLSRVKPQGGRPIFVPDHPDGPSIGLWDGSDWQRFTAAGVL